MNERYEIRRKIGQGGLGTVYQAFDNQLRRDVAIKRLFAPVDAAGNINRESTAEKLMREATALSRLNHPNIVSVFDVGVDADGGYVVMELLKGETLTDTIAKGTLTLGDFHQVVMQTLEALMAAEAQNMLHRDLKPSNIMVIWLPSGRFLVKVLDFGLAKVSAQPALQTIDQNNSVLGSIFYMAPEQFERRELDFSTDLYSMGCIYYFCLAGRDPFTGRSVADVMNAHLDHRVVPLHDIRPDLPREVSDWVMWLLRREMDARPKAAKIALDNFPLVEGSGGKVKVDSGRRFAIPQIVEASPALPVAAAVTGQRATTAPRPPVRNSGPVATRTTTSTRVHSGPVPTHRTGAAPVKGITQAQGRLTKAPGSSKPLVIKLAVLVRVLLVAGLGLVALNSKPNAKPAPLPPDALIASVKSVSRTSVAEGDEIQFSFSIKHRTGEYLRFGLIETDPADSSKCRGYAFDLEERQPVSLVVRRYSGEPSANVRQLSIPAGAAFETKLEGRNITVSQATKVEVRGKFNSAKNLSFTIMVWNTAGEKGTYKATDATSPLTSIQEYGFRGVRAVIDKIGDQRLAVAKPSKPAAPSGPPPDALTDPAALGLALLVDDTFDLGASPTPGDEADVPHDRAWEGSPSLKKPDPAKKITNVNGSNALGIDVQRSAYLQFPTIDLAEKRLIEVAFACRIDDSVDSLRVMLVNKTSDSRGYLVEFGRTLRIALHELRGQHAKDFPMEVSRQIHEASAPNPPPKISQAYQVRITVTRLKGPQTKVQITANYPGGKTATTWFTDPQGAYQFGAFGVQPRGKKGRILIDNVRIVSSTAPGG